MVANGANVDLFRPIARDCAPFAVFFGGLTAWHGVDLMLDAVRHPNWPAGVELVVIGAGAHEHLVQHAQLAQQRVAGADRQRRRHVPFAQRVAALGGAHHQPQPQ